MPPLPRTSRKVPEVTVFFWIVKILTTAMGESTSDYLVHRFDPVVAVIFGAIAFTAALALQFRVRRYAAPVYWLAVVMVAIFGTMAADVLHVRLGVPYAVSTVMFSAGLIAVFLVWYRTEKTLSIHSITTPRREAFYWATILATFALGTAVGDLTAYTFHLGFLTSGLLFTAIIAIPAVARLAGANEVFTFWFAYIVTRPLGASFADWLGTPHSLGGLNFGRGTTSLALTALIVAFVVYLSISQIDVERAPIGAHARGRD